MPPLNTPLDGGMVDGGNFRMIHTLLQLLPGFYGKIVTLYNAGFYVVL